MTTIPHRILAALLVLAAPAGFAADEPKSAPPTATAAAAPAPFLAKVGKVTISAQEYEAAANDAARRKFYHGQPPEAEVNALMREVADQMINRILLNDEAIRRGIKGDAAKTDSAIATYEERYKNSPMWQQNRERLLPGLRERLQQDSRLEQLEQTVRDTPKPTEADAKAYYKAHPDKFTEPEKLRLAIILLQVPPSSPTATWTAAEEEAARLVKRLKDGADFAELARMHSADESAESGGDLGYLHRGMVPEGLQGAIDEMKTGELSAPTRVLQGVAVFRLLDRQAPKHHDFATVQERATDLTARERSDQAWKDFLAGLRKKARIELNTQRYPALAAGEVDRP